MAEVAASSSLSSPSSVGAAMCVGSVCVDQAVPVVPLVTACSHLSSASTVPLPCSSSSSYTPPSPTVTSLTAPLHQSASQGSLGATATRLSAATSDDGKVRKNPSSIPTLVFDHADSPNGSQTSVRERLNSSESRPEDKSDLLEPPLSGGGVQKRNTRGSRWLQLRTTIRMATAIQSKKPRKSTSLMRQDSFLKRFSTRQGGLTSAESESDEEEQRKLKVFTAEEKLKKEQLKFVINPDENFMFIWLGILTMSVLYNLWTSIAREAFPEIQLGYEIMWYSFDASCDLIYIMDVVVQLRTGYLEKGLIVYNTKKLAFHYLKSRYFVLDMICLLPLDILQFYIGIHPVIRFPRFIKVYRSYRFSYMVETRTIFPNMWRVANLSHVLFLGSHWFAAFYFLISQAEGFKGHWGYPEPEGEFAFVTRKYLKSLYWSTLTLTTIGDLPPPTTNWE